MTTTRKSPQRPRHPPDLEARLREATETLLALSEEKRRHEAELAALLKAARTILETQEFRLAARQIFDSCKNLVGAASGYVALLSEDGAHNQLLFLDSGGLPCAVDPALPMPIRGLRAEAYRHRKTVYDNGFPESPWLRFMPRGHVRLDNVLFAPLVIGAKAVGLLGLANKPGGFSESDARTAASFGELASLALLNSRNLERLAASEKKYRDLVDNALVGVFQSTMKGDILYVNDYLVRLLGYASAEEARRQQAPARYKRPEQREALLAALRRRGSTTNFEIGLLRKDGDVRSVLLSAVLDGETLSGMIMDVTEKKRAEEELCKRHDELSALYAVAAALGRTLDRGELADIVLETVTGIGSLGLERKGCLFLLEGDRLQLVSERGHAPSFADRCRERKSGECLCGLAALTGETVVSSDAETDARHTIRHPGMAPHGHVVVPLKAKDRVLGVLCLHLPAGVAPDEEKVRLLGLICHQVGLALDNARLYGETKELSLHDPLTGLANRRLLDIILERHIAAAARHNTVFSVLMIDIDRFKKYNDTHGHPAGDRLLVALANLLSSDVRGIDFVVRYGGEEFLVLLPETDLAMAVEAAERIRRTVASRTAVTVSIGVACSSSGCAKADIIKSADGALYRAKKSGRNRVASAVAEG